MSGQGVGHRVCSALLTGSKMQFALFKLLVKDILEIQNHVYLIHLIPGVVLNL